MALKRKVGEQDKLYGSVTAMDLAEPIKTVGEFEVPVKLHSEVVGKAKVKVEAEA